MNRLFQYTLPGGTTYRWRYGPWARNPEGDYYVGDQYVEPSMTSIEVLMTFDWAKEVPLIEPDMEMDIGL